MKLIGLSGISGSGKTHMLNKLKVEFGDHLSVLSFDNYYKSIEHQQKDENGLENFDLPQGVDSEKFLQDLELLKQGISLKIKVYNFNNSKEIDRFINIHPAPVLLVEGIFVFYFQSILEQLDYKIYLHASETTSLNRRLKRDAKERGIGEEMNLYQWNNHAVPGFEKYVTKFKHQVDLMIHNDKNNDEAYLKLSETLKLLL